MKIILANPRGFCAGVKRAIAIVERALELYQTPIYVRHEIVHNSFVVQNLRQRGVVFVEHLCEVPRGAVVIFSAHGVSPTIRREANARQLTLFDATCPLVTKVHMEVARASKQGIETILIGHANHPEVEGTLGYYNHPYGGIYLITYPEDVEKLVVKDPDRLCFVTQTTLSSEDTAKVINALTKRFPSIVGPRKQDICYATNNRQTAVRSLLAQIDLLLVVGSPNSSNSNRLVELAQQKCIPAYLIDAVDELQAYWFIQTDVVGLTAGASAPEILVQQVIQRLRLLGATNVEEYVGLIEDVSFAIPKALQA